MMAGGLAVVQALAGTVILGLVASVLAAPVGVGVALWTRWLCPPLLRRAARIALGAVAGVPPACLAVGLILLPVEGWTWSVGLTTLGMALVAIPTVAGRAFEAFDKVPAEQVLQTISLGASPSQAVATAVLPSAQGGVFSAALLGTARAVGETVVVLLLLDGLGGQTTTLSRALVLQTLSPVDASLPIAMVLAAVLGVCGASLWVLGHRSRVGP